MAVPMSVCPHGTPPVGWAGRIGVRIQALLAAPAPVQWEVPVSGVLSLLVSQRSVLKVSAGQTWVTLRGPPPPCTAGHDSASRDSGDYFLQAGESLPVAAGQHLVLECVGSARGQGLLVRC